MRREFDYYFSAFIAPTTSAREVLKAELAVRFKREGKDWWKASESRMPVMRIPVGVIDTLRNQSLHVGEVLPGFRVLLHLADGMGGDGHGGNPLGADRYPQS